MTTFIDLFAGIGGFRYALEEHQGNCVFSSEIDPKARDTYKRNFGDEPAGDIRDFTGTGISDEKLDQLIPNHRILTGGFPCQPFSLAGVSSRNSLGRKHGFMDETQGTLFFDIARIAKVKQPDVLFLENVANLMTHNKKKTFETIKAVIENDLGYSFHAKVLSSATLVPQKRRRCFIVAFKNKKTPFSFPELTGPELPLSSILDDNVPDSFTLSDRMWAGHQRRTKHNKERGVGFSALEADLSKPSNTIVARYYKDGKECLIPQLGKNPRMLTPNECRQLQGFPESFACHPSKSVAYKQFGNAVAVPLVRAIFGEILKGLNSTSQARNPLLAAE
ncbi:MAG: DNA cytosine methyltransferase [Litoreibacter sp.]|uniref:DNA cytosine methyltransferase n=1 Tax=Litoreibacter sp. TaxID=1969459 RepID=UPI0032968CF8